MAASFHQKSFEHMTLVLEPADYTLNYFLHQMDTTLSIVESISVVQQIASAALYLQECGYIHSNISSHNILVRESPWCVKLSSFELTTEVDFADTRIDILVKYRHKLPSMNSSCADLPKYTAIDDQNISLKDQYKQMSKMLPILKCSPNTQVTLNMRQISRRSSDVDETNRSKMEEITEIRHTVCGSQKGLLTFNARTSKDGSSCGKNKYICSDCASKMSQDDLKALTFESVAESSLNATNVTDHSILSPITDCQTTPQRRCQVRVKSQNTRSIEDLYIDDDFDQGLGLGANIELQSDCSDFLNFDIISDVFNKSDVDA